MSEETYAVQEIYKEKLLVEYHESGPEYIGMTWMHFHDGYEIWISLTDGARFFIENEMYMVNRGGVMLVNNMEVHKVTSPMDKEFQRYIVSFVPEYIAEYDYGDGALFHAFVNRPVGITHCIQLEEEQLTEILCLIKMLERYIRMKGDDTEQLKKHCLAQLVILCNIYYESGDYFRAGESSEALKPIINYIKKNIAQPLPLGELAARFYMSKVHLIRLFKAEMGMTPNEYIIMMRVQKARGYLAEGMSVIRVCEMVGYADESHFIRTFKRIMGITPKQYGKLRKENKENKEM